MPCKRWSFEMLVHNRSFPELSATAHSPMWGVLQSSCLEMHEAWGTFYPSSHRLRARCSVGAKQQSLAVTFLRPGRIISAKNPSVSLSSKWLSLTSADEGPDFVISSPNLHPALPSAARRKEMWNIKDCWVMMLKREISQNIPETVSPAQFAELISGCQLWGIYLLSFPCFCC